MIYAKKAGALLLLLSLALCLFIPGASADGIYTVEANGVSAELRGLGSERILTDSSVREYEMTARTGVSITLAKDAFFAKVTDGEIKLDLLTSTKGEGGIVLENVKLTEDSVNGLAKISAGAVIKLNKAGDYTVGIYSDSHLKQGILLYITVSDDAAEATPVVPKEVLTRTAIPASAKVIIDGEEVAFGAYEIEGSNYFKLRDLALSLSGTDAQFEVLWDEGKNAISMTSGKKYTPVGGEMGGKSSGGGRTAVRTNAGLYIDGEAVSITGYKIADNNYFKLREIALAFDFGVTYDARANAIVIDTSVGYTPEE